MEILFDNCGFSLDERPLTVRRDTVYNALVQVFGSDAGFAQYNQGSLPGSCYTQLSLCPEDNSNEASLIEVDISGRTTLTTSIDIPNGVRELQEAYKNILCRGEESAPERTLVTTDSLS